MTKKFYFLFIALLSTITMYSQVSKDTMNVINLSDVQVTGSRPSVNTPISQKTITSLEISKDYHGQEMTYVLEKTPSVTTQSDGGQPNGYTYFRIRGIDQTRINVTLNGSPLTESEDLGAYYSNYPGFATFIKSIQVQRGVGTSSNGTSSYGGSINFESKDGLDKSGDVSFTNGSFSTVSSNVTYGTGLLKNKFAFYGGASAYSSDGYRYNSSGSGSSGFLSGGYYDTNDIIKFVSFSGRSLNQMAWFAVPESQINLDPKTNVNPRGENDDFSQTFLQLHYTHKLNKTSLFTTTTFYNRLDGVWGMFVSPTDLLNFGLKSNFYGLSFNYNYSIKNLKVNAGVNMNGYNREHTGVISDILQYTNTGFKKDESGYLKCEYIYGNLVMFGDLQVRTAIFSYDGSVIMNDIKWNFFNPRGGLTFKITEQDNIYLSVGQSHREPTRTDLFGGNDDLITLNIIKPESVIDYELGLNLVFNKFKLHSNVYFMDFKDEIILSGAIGSNSLPLMTSVDKSFRSGAELDLVLNINKYFSISNSSSYSYNRILGNSVEYSPLYSPNLIINQNVEYNNKGFNIVLTGRYVSDSYIDFANTQKIPNYFLLNTKVGYKFNNISLSVDAINLTNKKYYSSGYIGTTENSFYVGTPISFYTTVKVNF